MRIDTGLEVTLIKVTEISEAISFGEKIKIEIVSNRCEWKKEKISSRKSVNTYNSISRGCQIP